MTIENEVPVHEASIIKLGAPHPSREYFPLHVVHMEHTETIERQFNLTREDAQLLHDWLSVYLAGK